MKTEIKTNASFSQLPSRYFIDNESEIPASEAPNDFFPVICVSVIIGCAIGLSCLIELTHIPELISGFACEAIHSTIKAAAAPY
ncbi:MAG: hypothetical protein ACI9R3_003714 [Verrucomicrobiales bacterium]|jgi:hypothetical protein